MVGNGYEPELNDAVLRGEIELLADVMLAAALVDARFTREQVDQLLGLVDEKTSQVGTGQ